MVGLGSNRWKLWFGTAEIEIVLVEVFIDGYWIIEQATRRCKHE